jgi:hypothetical protein
MTNGEKLDELIASDGRHFQLFCDLKSGKISQEEFNAKESDLMKEIIGKMMDESCARRRCCLN